MITQSENHEISVKVKGLEKKLAVVITYITGMKYVNEKLEKYNELLDDNRNRKPRLMKLCAMRILKY